MTHQTQEQQHTIHLFIAWMGSHMIHSTFHSKLMKNLCGKLLRSHWQQQTLTKMKEQRPLASKGFQYCQRFQAYHSHRCSHMISCTLSWRTSFLALFPYGPAILKAWMLEMRTMNFCRLCGTQSALHVMNRVTPFPLHLGVVCPTSQRSAITSRQSPGFSLQHSLAQFYCTIGFQNPNITNILSD